MDEERFKELIVKTGIPKLTLEEAKVLHLLCQHEYSIQDLADNLNVELGGAETTITQNHINAWLRNIYNKLRLDEGKRALLPKGEVCRWYHEVSREPPNSTNWPPDVVLPLSLSELEAEESETIPEDGEGLAILRFIRDLQRRAPAPWMVRPAIVVLLVAIGYFVFLLISGPPPTPTPPPVASITETPESQRPEVAQQEPTDEIAPPPTSTGTSPPTIDVHATETRTIEQFVATLTAEAPQITDTPSTTPTPSRTPTPSLTPTPSDTPTPTDTPLPTNTPPPTNTPTPSRPPSPTSAVLAVGETGSDDRVALTLVSMDFFHVHQWTASRHQYEVFLSFALDNLTQEPVVLIFDLSDFQITDEHGRSPGRCQMHDPNLLWEVNRTLEAVETYQFGIGCDDILDDQVYQIIVSVDGVASLGPISWVRDVPR